MRWFRFGTGFFACDCEKRKMYWAYIEFFGKKQAGKDVPKMRHRINQRFLNILHDRPGRGGLCSLYRWMKTGSIIDVVAAWDFWTLNTPGRPHGPPSPPAGG